MRRKEFPANEKFMSHKTADALSSADFELAEIRDNNFLLTVNWPVI